MEVQHAVEARVGISEAAAMVGLSTDTIRRAADAGKLAHIRTPGGQRRFLASDVLALVTPASRDESAAAPSSHGAAAPIGSDS